MKLHRRGLISAALATFAVFPLPKVWATADSATPIPDPWREQVDRWIVTGCSDKAATQSVGQRCLDAGAVARDPDILFRCLFAHHRPASRRALQSYLAETRRNDFAAGSVVLVDGWVLAQSESLYASYAATLLEGAHD